MYAVSDIVFARLLNIVLPGAFIRIWGLVYRPFFGRVAASASESSIMLRPARVYCGSHAERERSSAHGPGPARQMPWRASNAAAVAGAEDGRGLCFQGPLCRFCGRRRGAKGVVHRGYTSALLAEPALWIPWQAESAAAIESAKGEARRGWARALLPGSAVQIP